ncbi:methyl-accepting chemotaxis protein [Geminicoccus harenae]|uniref:methyl-accepting chemotaxis protein n=1 Tax=Geminicoccus harenae TaxID=2498453 RepID=UPI00168B96E8|nr:methyl-accepting chemotaxis protein [Geminicoccus harenae]
MWLSVRQKILVTFGIIVLLMLALGLYQLHVLRTVRDLSEQIVEHDLTFLNDVNGIVLVQQQAHAARNRLRDVTLLAALGNGSANRQDALAEWQNEFTELRQAVGALRASLQGRLDDVGSAGIDQQIRQLIYTLAAAEDLIRQLEPIVLRQFDALSKSDFAMAEDAQGQAARLADQIEERFTSLRTSVVQLVNEAQDWIEQMHRTAAITVAAAFAGIVLASIVAAWLLQRSITRPLARFARFAEQIGAGDLTASVTIGSKDEISQLAQHLNGMVAGLRELAIQSRTVSESLNAATQEIRTSTQQQAASVEEQLASVQETSATLDEITQSGAQVSKRAQELSLGTEETVQASSNGLQAVGDTARVMDKIREQVESVAENIVMLSERTHAVGDIIATVNDIAERSHILALNAAIEAAAAGEHGRSFAVVAAEIKNLADQSKEATVQVRAVLGDIQRGINTSVMLTEEAVKRISSGTAQTDQAQGAINHLTDTIQESSDTFQQIVAAINQQHIGLEQVMIALRNIRQASTQTADGTRQLDRAAANLSTLSGELVQSIGRYHL